MPTPYEQPSAPALPEIDLQALFSPASQSEVMAATAFRPETLSLSDLPNLVEREANRLRDRIAADQDQLASRLIHASEPGPSLESIFMESAAREVGMDQVAALAYALASVDTFNIDYDLDDNTEVGRGFPNEAVRFQVGRESPPHRPFSAQNQSQDGVVVSQRGAGGRFETTSQRRSYEPLGPAMPRYEARTVRPNYAPIVSVDTSPSTHVEAPAMSALDVISGSSFDDI